ncbi:MAG: ribonuclease PH [Anaerolineae bacterium]|nr:ribonuclease PH [Anaerolineae bacterium]
MPLRHDGRQLEQPRLTQFVTPFTQWAEGSVLVQCGQTHVLCNVTLEERLPPWLKMKGSPHGWLTAEYALLPRSTKQRVDREQRWPKGRTQEISRLIGRSLRMAVDLVKLGPRQLIVDCDVLQADGGTRTAAVTGAWVAVALALRPLIQQGVIPANVLRHQVAAISVGVVAGQPVLDLDYPEDSSAEADMNVVMTGDGQFIEVQGTAEGQPFSRPQLDTLLNLAAVGIHSLLEQQRQLLAST